MLLGPLAVLSTCWPRAAGRLRRALSRRVVPDLPTRMEAGREVDPAGLTLDEQVSVAHAALTTMGLTSGSPRWCCSAATAAPPPTTRSPPRWIAAPVPASRVARTPASWPRRSTTRGARRPGRVGLTIPELHLVRRRRARDDHRRECRCSTVTAFPGTHRDRLARSERDLGSPAPTRRRTPTDTAGRRRHPGTGHDRRSAAAPTTGPNRCRSGASRGNAAVVVGPRRLTAGVDLRASGLPALL